MLDVEKLHITKAIMTLSENTGIDKREISNYLDSLFKMDISDAFDNILVTLNYTLNNGLISYDDIIANVSLLLNICPNEYKSTSDLIKRINYLKDMNLERPSMSLEENHELVLETFREFNKIIGDKLDAYYTGGLFGYIRTNQDLIRYHGDLDMIINEDDLMTLKRMVSESDDFNFVSNMDTKEENGHEYKITYQDKMSIGLFLFARNDDGSITNKEYYYDDDNKLYMNLRTYPVELTDLCLDDRVHEYKDTVYRTISLEYIYNQKKNGRPKDRFDASNIERYVDFDKESRISTLKGDVEFSMHQKADKNIIDRLEKTKKKK